MTEGCQELEGKSLKDAMICWVEKTGRKFVFIIDEWDALIREAKNDAAAQKKSKRKLPLPALVIELKWNKSADGAVRQIKERNYPEKLKDYGGEIVLAGINYDSKKKQHSCVIERI